MAQVELRTITKKYGKVTALDQVSFVIPDGKLFVLLGASGAGKSTTIGVISGIVTHDSGGIFLDGRDISQAFPQNRDIATAFESYSLYPHFTVFQNLLFPLESPERKKQMLKPDREKRVKEVADMLGLGELLKRYPRELSGGQKQRVALGRTLVRRPKAYMLDEPIAHLDAKLRHHMRSELKKIQTELGITTLYATPDQLEALSMGDIVAVLNKGVVEQIGMPDEIYYNPVNLFVASFVGDPPMNLFSVDYQGDHVIVECDTPYSIPLLPEDQKMLTEKMGDCRLKVGVRPVNIQLTASDDPKAHTQGEVILIDTLGQTSIVTVRLKSEEIKAKIPSDHLPKLHSTVGLQFDSQRFYYFDAATTRSIC